MSGGITINSNLAALSAQRRLGSSTSALQQSFTRLSSGLRINKASDDAAGLAISESLKTDQRVFAQGLRNLNDGVSLISIADGALSELSSIVTRLTELAEQSANGTLGNAQRKALDEEAQALKAEFFRITKSTEFNGQKLFDGTFGELRLQGGYGTNGGIVTDVGGAIGTGSFGNAETFSIPGIPGTIATADFNGDGILDLATSDFGSNINVLLGLGGGSFSSPTSFDAGAGTIAISAGDVNGDGVLDLVSVQSAGDTASVSLGIGDGTFAPATSYAVEDEPFEIVIGDFNGDGVPDLATADRLSSTVSLLLGVGDGTFGPRTSFATTNGPSGIQAGDFNGDGVLDVVTADRYGQRVSVLLGTGDGKLAPLQSYVVGVGPRDVTVGDFNSDGILDLATADFSSGTTSVLLGVGDGTFSPRTTFEVGLSAIAIESADFNGDGILDLVTSNFNDDTVSVLLGVGDGSFGPRTTFAVGDGPRVTAVGDLDGDGVNDLVTADNLGGTATLLRGQTTTGVAPLLDFSLATQAGARQALPVFKSKLDHLASQRGQLGAVEARLSTAVNNLAVARENFGAAASQIADADVAEEAARLVRNQILQQAGSAVLAQANQQPAIALSLLQALR